MTTYVILETENNYIVVGKERADAISQLLTISDNIVAEFNSEELILLNAYVASSIYS